MPSETQACLDDIGVCLPSKGDLTNATSRKPVRIDFKDGNARRKPEDISWMLDRQSQSPSVMSDSRRLHMPTARGRAEQSKLRCRRRAWCICGSSMILGGHVAHAVMCKQWAHHVTATHHTTHVAVCSAGGGSSDGGWAWRWMAWRHRW